MASGTGNLPNQDMSFSPFAILTAEEMNDLVENIESLADGSGIGDGAIGQSKMSNPYLFRVWRSSAYNLTSSLAAIPFDTEIYDVNNNFSAGEYTAPVTGYYHFSGRISTVSTLLVIELRVGGSAVARGGDSRPSSSTIGVVVSTTIHLTAGDKVTIYAASSGTTALVVTDLSQNYFAGYLVAQG